MRLILVLSAIIAAGAAELGQVAVNDYTGAGWTREPVSWDVDRDPALPIGVADRPSQSEPIPGSPGKVRVWTLVDMPAAGQQVFTLTDAPAAIRMEPLAQGEPARGLKTVLLGNGVFQVRVPAESKDFGPAGISGFQLPGPVVAVKHAGAERWVGDSWLELRRPVRSIAAEVEQGPLWQAVRLTYALVGGGTWSARVRVWQNDRPYAEITESMDLGGDSRWIFNYGDFPAKRHLPVRDGGLKSEPVAFKEDNEAGDFITMEGQNCLARLTVWSQFGYFHGKNEALGLFADDDSLYVGAFYIRPDLWTRAKVNHVDLYQRPEVPGRPETRGVLGLAGAQRRLALEAWLVDGRRQWGITALPPRHREEEARRIERFRAELPKRIATLQANAPDKRTKKTLPPEEVAARIARLEAEEKELEATTWVHAPFIVQAHVRIGIWPLDRLNRLPLTWNADGSPVPLAAQAPRGAAGDGGIVQRVLTQTAGRGGLATFNGSEGTMRGGMIRTGRSYLEWARANPGVKAEAVDVTTRMASIALAAYFGMDESAYPGRRAMLPWTDPEALNPFYQGMENMNFNADRYASVAVVGAGLKAAGHPEGARILDHGREQLDLSLGRYIYPDSGCWEESHGYCSHTMKNATILAKTLREMGAGDFFADRRFAKLFGFWTLAHSPRDPGFGDRRVPPPIGDHGLGVGMFTSQIAEVVGEFARAGDPEIQRTARNLSWLLGEISGPEAAGSATLAALTAGVPAEEPDLRSRYLQGYGSTLRSRSPEAGESYVVVRAEQSWGHHHMDKGSLWFWGRNVHFFGDAAWGGPPGPTYGNDYKQGPAGGTQIEFVGVNNWPLPCKYPAPWIAEDRYAEGYDYVLARCQFPFNPELDLTSSGPAVRRIGCDRQVLFVHGDLLIVRDNIESPVPTIWRMHAYQTDGLAIEGAQATMPSPQGVTGHLRILAPAGAVLAAVPRHDGNKDKETGKALDQPFGRAAGTVNDKGEANPYDTRSIGLRWDMPLNTSATWTFAVNGKGQPSPATEALDPEGRVVRAALADGREVIAFLDDEPFAWEGRGISFRGRVGLVIRSPAGVRVEPISAEVLTAR